MDTVCGTRLANGGGRFATLVTIAVRALVVLTVCRTATAGELQARILDGDGHGVPDVVVVAIPTDTSRAAPEHAGASAVMDQQHRRFVPQVLVVQTGTVVAFPNNDTVSHQVYSFSPARRFQLPLYKGEAHSPVTFDKAGLVVLGCNIHDEMVGYVFVTDSPWFSKTGDDGMADMRNVPAGQYRLEVWGPRVADAGETLVRQVTLVGTGPVVTEWRLQRPLRPHPSPGPRDVDWDY